MKTAQQYKNQVAEIDLAQIKTENLTPAEAKQNLSRLEEIHTRVRELEVSLNLDIHALRSQYQGRIASHSINPRHNARIEEERRVEEERDAKLAPYEEARTQVRTLITELAEKQAVLEKIQA